MTKSWFPWTLGMSTFPHLSLTFPNWKPHLLAVTLSPHRSHRHLMTTTLTHKRTRGKMRMWLITGRVILVQNGTYMIHLPPFGSLGIPLGNEWILNPMLHLEGNSKRVQNDLAQNQEKFCQVKLFWLGMKALCHPYFCSSALESVVTTTPKMQLVVRTEEAVTPTATMLTSLVTSGNLKAASRYTVEKIPSRLAEEVKTTTPMTPEDLPGARLTEHSLETKQKILK